MKRKIKYLAAAIISIIPRNTLRVFLYRVIFGYKIASDARIGFGTKILVEEAMIGSANIGMFNLFDGPMKIEIGDEARICSRNIFYCAEWTLNPEFKNSSYSRTCLIGAKTLVTENHFIDCTGGFELQADSWIAGRNSQFWTHGAGVTDRSIVIGRNCYIGSAVCFAPGVSLGKNCLVGLGSVVTKKFDEDNLFIEGNPAKIIAKDYPGRVSSK